MAERMKQQSNITTQSSRRKQDIDLGVADVVFPLCPITPTEVHLLALLATPDQVFAPVHS